MRRVVMIDDRICYLAPGHDRGLNRKTPVVVEDRDDARGKSILEVVTLNVFDPTVYRPVVETKPFVKVRAPDRASDAQEPRRGVFRALRKDRKSTRLNSSHSQISYAVFC